MLVKLLIVEDHPDLARSLSRGLKLEGYTVEMAKDGLEGEYFIQNYDYDCIILDLMLPGKGGWELLQQVREKGNTPVLILSAKDTVDDRIQVLNAGADDYLVKPFAYDELKARLASILRRSTGNQTHVISYGELELNSQSQTIRVAGQAVDITAREYMVLATLMRNQGKVVSRADIYDHIGEFDDDSLSNAIDVMICKLRKKIGKDVIQTRRGVGYIIEAK